MMTRLGAIRRIREDLVRWAEESGTVRSALGGQLEALYNRLGFDQDAFARVQAADARMVRNSDLARLWSALTLEERIAVVALTLPLDRHEIEDCLIPCLRTVRRADVVQDSNGCATVRGLEVRHDWLVVEVTSTQGALPVRAFEARQVSSIRLHDNEAISDEFVVVLDPTPRTSNAAARVAMTEAQMGRLRTRIHDKIEESALAHLGG